MARAFRNVLDDIDERRSVQSFASVRSSRSSMSRRLQWQRRPNASVESTVSEGGYMTSSAAARRGCFANYSAATGGSVSVTRTAMSVDCDDLTPVNDGSYTNMALSAESRRASTKSRSYENVGGTSSINATAGTACVVMATSDAPAPLLASSSLRITKQASLPVTITTVNRPLAGPPGVSSDYMSTHDSDVNLRQFTLPTV